MRISNGPSSQSDGHDTLLTEIPDIAANLVWPGATSRSCRNRFIERWARREWVLRQHQAEALAGVQAARRSGALLIQVEKVTAQL